MNNKLNNISTKNLNRKPNENTDESLLTSSKASFFVDPVKAILKLVNLAAMPFHHLIPAKLLLPNFPLSQNEETQTRSKTQESKNKADWINLINNDLSPQEVMLYSNVLEQKFFEFNGEKLNQINWKVFLKNPIQGCAEFYLAEMFLFKKLLFELKNEQLESLSFDMGSFEKNFKTEDYAALRSVIGTLIGIEADRNEIDEKIFRMFFNSLASDFEIFNSSFMINNTPQWQVEKRANVLLGDYFKSNFSQLSRRLDRQKIVTEGSEPMIIHLYLEVLEFWLEWQRNVQKISFDFDLLEKIKDARSIRFYEITKLLRITEDSLKEGVFSATLEIDYEKFVALFPLPQLNDEKSIKQQIRQIIAPLRKEGYLKSFNLRTPNSSFSTNSSLKFRFND